MACITSRALIEVDNMISNTIGDAVESLLWKVGNR